MKLKLTEAFGFDEEQKNKEKIFRHETSTFG